jgi:hypothetical protein
MQRLAALFRLSSSVVLVRQSLTHAKPLGAPNQRMIKFAGSVGSTPCAAPEREAPRRLIAGASQRPRPPGGLIETAALMTCKRRAGSVSRLGELRQLLGAAT